MRSNKKIDYFPKLEENTKIRAKINKVENKHYR